MRLPSDCDDTKPGIKPGAPEIIDDGVDQDCSGADVRTIKAQIASQWVFAKTYTQVGALKVTDVPAGSVIEVRCSPRKNRCPFTSKKRTVSRATTRCRSRRCSRSAS